MNKSINLRAVDLSAIATINLFNLIMIIVFLLRTLQAGHSLVTGIIWVVFIVVFIVVVFQNIKARRSRWFVILPSLMGTFLVVEVILDYVLKYDFRNTSLIGPYLLLYYVSVLGMIGYSFLVEKKYGFVTLVTYFLSQFAALYSYLQVGHG